KVYQVTSDFPKEEKYGLVSQLRRCVVSIGSNIAEGAGRNTTGDFKHFLGIAYGSSYELETQLIIANNLKMLDDSDSEKLCNEIDELQKMIYVFSNKLN
ncbi:MAG TPA: four helix bundle protein, partial [Balneolaceae bacterium]|nr:four helix bundle protein [Balneolaceae bacterium]